MNYKEMNDLLKKEISKEIPNFNVFIKERSSLMRFFGKIMFFNKFFMTRYITTFYPNIYFPRETLKDAQITFSVLAHEFVHLLSAKRKSPIFHGFLYGLPQILATLSLLSILAIWFSNMWLLNLLWLLLLAPIPAYFRTEEELDAYTMSLYVAALQKNSFPNVTRKQLKSHVDYISENFYGSNYYFMWPFKKNITEKLNQRIDKIAKGDYDNVYPYNFVKKLFNK